MDPERKQAIEAAKQEAKTSLVQVQSGGEFANFLDAAKFTHIQRVAEVFSRSSMVPPHFQGNAANCIIALEMAVRMNMHPFMLFQNMYVVHGRPGLQAQLLIALVNERGPFTGPIQYELKGEGMARSCRAYATHKVTGEVCEFTVDMNMVHAEGWDQDKVKDGKTYRSKWNTMRDLMFRYRSATMLARVYCPEVLMGLKADDELEDTLPAPTVTITNPKDDPNADVPDFPPVVTVPLKDTTVDAAFYGEPVATTTIDGSGPPVAVNEIKVAQQPALDLPDPGREKRRLEAVATATSCLRSIPECKTKKDMLATAKAFSGNYDLKSVEDMTEAEALKVIERAEKGKV